MEHTFHPTKWHSLLPSGKPIDLYEDAADQGVADYKKPIAVEDHAFLENKVHEIPPRDFFSPAFNL